MPLDSVSKLLGNFKLRAEMRLVDHRKAEDSHTSAVIEEMSKVAKKTVLIALQIGSELANDCLKTASYYFVKQILMRMAQNDALKNLFDSNIECWTQSWSFTDACARRVLIYFWFARLVAIFLRENLKKQPDVNCDERNVRDAQLL